MKPLTKLVLCLLIAALLPAMSACTETETPLGPDSDAPRTEGQDTAGDLPTDTVTETDTDGKLQAPPRDVYEDLSFGIPAYTDPGTKTVTVTSEGTADAGRVRLDFTALSGLYVVSSTKIGFSCHDVASCDSCGYVDTEDGGAYLFSSEGKDQGGVTVTLSTPSSPPRSRA